MEYYNILIKPEILEMWYIKIHSIFVCAIENMYIFLYEEFF